MLRWLIAILGASIGITNFLLIVLIIVILMAAFGGFTWAWLIIGAFAAIMLVVWLYYIFCDNISKKASIAWEKLPDDEKRIWEEINCGERLNQKDVLSHWGKEAYVRRAVKRANLLDFFRKEFKKKVAFPKTSWLNDNYITDKGVELIKELGPEKNNNKGWRVAFYIVLTVFCLMMGTLFYYMVKPRQILEISPQERLWMDSISYKERHESDSIRWAAEKARKGAHEEYIRKMARDIVNSDRSNSRGDNMRGWDPASEDDAEEDLKKDK